MDESTTAKSGSAYERIGLHYSKGSAKSSTDEELPLRILLLGDFFRRLSTGPLDEMTPIVIEGGSLSDVMKAADLEISIEVADHLYPDNTEPLRLVLRFDSLHDFTPDGVISGVPALSDLRRLRETIACLTGPWFSMTVPGFRVELLALLRSPDSRRALLGELERESTPLLDSIVVETGLTVHDGHAHRLLIEGLRAFIGWAGPASEDPPTFDDEMLPRYIAEMDRRLERQINEVLHHPEFQAIEASWRGIEFLLKKLDFSENIELEFANVLKKDLLDDFEDVAKITHSWLYRTVYSGGYGTFGGTPYGVVGVLHEFDRSPLDIFLLTNIAAIGALSHTPILVGASPRIFRLNTYAQLASLRSIRELFDQPHHQPWDRLRDASDARYLGMCLPRVLLRAPYIGVRVPPDRWQTFQFIESVADDESHYLWGPGSLVLLSRIAASFARYRWCPHIIGVNGGGEEDGLPWHRTVVDGEGVTIGPCDVSIGDRLASELDQHGFICLRFGRTPSQAVFMAVPALQRRQAGSTANPREYRLASTFMISRVAQYIKVLHREWSGTVREVAGLEEKFNEWLRQYISPGFDLPIVVRSRKPFKQAKIAVAEVPEQIEWFRYQLSIEPHMKARDGGGTTLSVVGKLDRG